MAVSLRLTRMGSKQKPFYRIVATDSRVKRDGKYLELLGTYNPLNGEKTIKKDAVIKWLENGAKPTDTVRNILSEAGILKEFHEKRQQQKQQNSKDKK